MKTCLGWWSLAAVAGLACGSVRADQQAAPLSVGWASVDVTPPKPAPLIGQYSRRIARTTRDPIPPPRWPWRPAAPTQRRSRR